MYTNYANAAERASRRGPAEDRARLCQHFVPRDDRASRPGGADGAHPRWQRVRASLASRRVRPHAPGWATSIAGHDLHFRNDSTRGSARGAGGSRTVAGARARCHCRSACPAHVSRRSHRPLRAAVGRFGPARRTRATDSDPDRHRSADGLRDHGQRRLGSRVRQWPPIRGVAGPGAAPVLDRGKTKLGRITQRGDAYLRMLLMLGARFDALIGRRWEICSLSVPQKAHNALAMGKSSEIKLSGAVQALAYCGSADRRPLELTVRRQVSRLRRNTH